MLWEGGHGYDQKRCSAAVSRTRVLIEEMHVDICRRQLLQATAELRHNWEKHFELMVLMQVEVGVVLELVMEIVKCFKKLWGRKMRQ